MRKQVSFQLTDTAIFKQALLCWSQQFDEVLWLDSNGHSGQYSSFESVLAADALTAKVTDFKNAFDDLKEYQQETNDWVFGYLSYDLKNDIEKLSSRNIL